MKRLVVIFIISLGIVGSVYESWGGDKEFEVCRKKLIVAQKADLLYDLKWELPREPTVVIGPTFYRIPFDAKENFVKTVNCFLVAGDSGKLVNFDLLDWRTNQKVARFSFGKLKIKD